MLKFKTSCAVLAYLSSNLLNELGLSLFRYLEVGLRVCDIVVKKFTFAFSSPDEFLLIVYFKTTKRKKSLYPDFKPPDGGVSWDDLSKIFRVCQRMVKVANGVETLPKISTS